MAARAWSGWKASSLRASRGAHCERARRRRLARTTRVQLAEAALAVALALGKHAGVVGEGVALVRAGGVAQVAEGERDAAELLRAAAAAVLRVGLWVGRARRYRIWALIPTI